MVLERALTNNSVMWPPMVTSKNSRMVFGTIFLLCTFLPEITSYLLHSPTLNTRCWGSGDISISQFRPQGYARLQRSRNHANSLGLSMMFDQLSGQLSGAMRKLSGQATITDKNIESALKDVRRSLLEADVNIDVATELINDIRKRAVGMSVVEGVTPAQQFIKIMSV